MDTEGELRGRPVMRRDPDTGLFPNEQVYDNPDSPTLKRLQEANRLQLQASEKDLDFAPAEDEVPFISRIYTDTGVWSEDTIKYGIWVNHHDYASCYFISLKEYGVDSALLIFDDFEENGEKEDLVVVRGNVPDEAVEYFVGQYVDAITVKANSIIAAAANLQQEARGHHRDTDTSLRSKDTGLFPDERVYTYQTGNSPLEWAWAAQVLVNDQIDVFLDLEQSDFIPYNVTADVMVDLPITPDALVFPDMNYYMLCEMAARGGSVKVYEPYLDEVDAAPLVIVKGNVSDEEIQRLLGIYTQVEWARLQPAFEQLDTLETWDRLAQEDENTRGDVNE